MTTPPLPPTRVPINDLKEATLEALKQLRLALIAEHPEFGGVQVTFSAIRMGPIQPTVDVIYEDRPAALRSPGRLTVIRGGRADVDEALNAPGATE